VRVPTGTYANGPTVGSGNNPSPAALPGRYSLGGTAGPLVITQDVTLNIQVNAIRLIVHVQDPLGNPVPGASVTVYAPASDIARDQALNTSLGAFVATSPGEVVGGATADASGSAALWVLPTTPQGTYDIEVGPPGGTFADFGVNLSILSDKSVVIALQYIHAPPVTVVTMSPSPSAQGVYPGSVTGTLVANAFAGFSVAATYYTVDGGATQSYVAPFVVSGDGSHSIRYWSVDNIGVTEAPKMLTFQIQSNQPPTVQTSGLYSVNEAGSVVVTASGHDPEGGPLTYAWDLDNNGSFETLGQSVTFSAVGFDDPSAHMITVRVTDSGNLTATAQAVVTVVNVPPAVGAINALVDPVPVNTAINTSAAFTDPGALDTHTAIWDWSDNSTSVGSVNETNGSGSVTGSHIYTSVGVYTVKVAVTDDDGGSGESIFQYIVVYDPNAGFVTGGGWINSPAGVYTPNPSLTGKANFGFVSKYQKGATVPSGQTEFQFQLAGLNFHSISYDWLVLAGAKAQYKGSGTINGSGDYGFILTAIDGQVNGGGGVDKFRIKIWDKGTGNVIYDNQMGAGDTADPNTAIAGGSIVIHK
jgi:hypothetical protein